jgi:hypothetical protein
MAAEVWRKEATLMHSFLSNLSLFASATAKVGLVCGFVPAIALAFFGPRVAKFWCPLSLGKQYRVEGYHTGDFVGEVEAVDRDRARVRVTDPMRPMPRVKNRCCFPECVREDFHFGDHEFARVREGVLLEVSWRAAKWIPFPSSGGEQLATPNGLIPTLSNRATSSPRKVRRYA